MIDDLFKCLTSSAYGTDVQMPSRLRLAPDGSSRNLRELGYHVEESGLMVFEPAIPQYYNFPALLQLVEDSAGRMQGVVKIILPEGM